MSNEDAPAPAKPKNKRLSVERIYQKKTQLEHILLRPDTYVGSTEEITQKMWIYDEELDAIVNKTITFVPGLYKIFDEILVNAADNKQRCPEMNAIKITIKPEDNLIQIWNNGKGIPVEMHKEEKVYVPALIFGQLLTSSNYDDDERKVTGGRNGYGAKLCNIFSSEFTIETSCKESGRMFKQTWRNNMSKAEKEIIKSSKDDYTVVTFRPDLSKFKMTELDKDTVSLLTKRAYDIAGCTKGVKVFLNGKRLPIKTFQDYVQLYLKVKQDDEDELMGPRKILYEEVNPRWEVCVTLSSVGFQQASFVNSIATTKGGTHVKHVVDPLVNKLSEVIQKKNKGGVAVKPFQIKNHLWVFINCLIENPSFDSQTKENMTLKERSFGSKCNLSEKFIKSVLSCGVVESILQWAKIKSQTQLQKASGSSAKRTRLTGVAKLEDANDAGGKNSQECTLILTEGDSAKTLAVSGLGVVGRDRFGVFPLRGKLLNVREASHKQVMNNEEILNVVKIMGLKYGQKYDDEKSLKTLRYGHICIMADQDPDGSHIKGLVINFIHHNWPSLIKTTVLQEFITPIVKATKGSQEHSFYSLPEMEQWKAANPNYHTWKIKYYKGLGTSTSKEAKEYFSDMARHRIPFKYGGPEDDQAIELAFSKKQVQERKDWLTSWLQQRKDKRMAGLNESFLYGQEMNKVTYTEFVNKELILFSNMDNERSIPNLMDGFKPGQRKVMYTCFKRNDKKDIKVAQLAGSVAEISAYHHGEQSLMGTIINLAQDYVASNNVNLLQPIGQFGTRLNGGKDCASPRYIFTMLSPLARLIFNPIDDNQLNYLHDDNLRIEPEWYCPVIPMVLVNGAEGIGTGYSTYVPNYDPRVIVSNLKRMINGMEPVEMSPWYKNFTGRIVHVEPHKYINYGCISRLGPTTLEITELPLRTWTQGYKESVLEPMLLGSEKSPPFISDYKEYHTDTTVKFVVTLSEQKMSEAEKAGFYKKFKLEGYLNTSNMVLFDHNMCLKQFSGPTEILKVFYDVRLEHYQKRKEWLEGKLSAEASKATYQAKFIEETIEGTLVVARKNKKEVLSLLKKRGYPSDPLKAWKAMVSKDEGESEPDESQDDTTTDGTMDYDYLLGLTIWCLTVEKQQELLKLRDAKTGELLELKKKTVKQLWIHDLDAFLEALEKQEEKEKEELMAGQAITKKSSKQKGGRQTKLTSMLSSQKSATMPSAYGEVIEPVIPEFQEKVVKKVRPKKTAEEKEKTGTKRKKSDDVEGVSPSKKAKEEITKVKMPKKKKVENSDDNSSDDDVDSIASMETEPLAVRVARQSRTIKPVKYNIDDDDEEDDDDDDDGGGGRGSQEEVVSEEEWMAIDSDEDSDEAPKKANTAPVITVVKEKPKKPVKLEKPKKTVQFEAISEESKDVVETVVIKDDEVTAKTTTTKTTKPNDTIAKKTTKPKATKSKKKASDDGEEKKSAAAKGQKKTTTQVTLFDVGVNTKKTKTTKPKAAAVKKKAFIDESSDDDDDFPSVTATPPKPATRVARSSKAVKYTDSDLDFSDDNDGDDDWDSN
ncbi:DNA topoisomerase 2-alpha-like isoform X2 [Dysidea avara]